MIDFLTKQELQKMFGSVEKAATAHGKTKQAFYQAINKQTDVCDKDLTIKIIGTAILEGYPERLPSRFLTPDVVSCLTEDDLTHDIFEDIDSHRSGHELDVPIQEVTDVA